MATPTEALKGLNELNELYQEIKAEMYTLLDEKDKINEEINKRLLKIEEMENKYVELISDLA